MRQTLYQLSRFPSPMFAISFIELCSSWTSKGYRDDHGFTNPTKLSAKTLQSSQGPVWLLGCDHRGRSQGDDIWMREADIRHEKSWESSGCGNNWTTLKKDGAAQCLSGWSLRQEMAYSPGAKRQQQQGNEFGLYFECQRRSLKSWKQERNN